MLALAGAELGLNTTLPRSRLPAAHVSSAFTAAAYDDEAALSAFAAAVDAVTYEFENIPVATVVHIAATKNVFPSAKAPKSANRFEENLRRMQGFDVADFFDITDLASLEAALAQCDGTGISKPAASAMTAKVMEV